MDACDAVGEVSNSHMNTVRFEAEKLDGTAGRVRSVLVVETETARSELGQEVVVCFKKKYKFGVRE